MQIGIPKQTTPERRVALGPTIAKKLIGSGHEILLESEAGKAAGWPDDAYSEVGVTIVSTERALSAELVVTVTGLPADPGTGVVLGLLRPFDDPAALSSLVAAGATIFAFEAVPRITRAQSMDALSSQATVAGYQAVVGGAATANRMFPMLTTAAGTIPPARVLVLGAGVAGLQAIATARRLGAVVSAFDVRSAAAEQVRSLGASFVEIDVAAQDEKTSGGYATQVAEDEQSRIIEALLPSVADADLVISTAAIPGRPAPRLIEETAVAAMRPGSVIVDLAASTGGNCSLTRPGHTVVAHQVTIIGDTSPESHQAGDASNLYSRNVAAFLELLTGEDGRLEPDWDDEIVAQTCIARDGRLIHPRLTGS